MTNLQEYLDGFPRKEVAKVYDSLHQKVGASTKRTYKHNMVETAILKFDAEMKWHIQHGYCLFIGDEIAIYQTAFDIYLTDYVDFLLGKRAGGF